MQLSKNDRGTDSGMFISCILAKQYTCNKIASIPASLNQMSYLP